MGRYRPAIAATLAFIVLVAGCTRAAEPEDPGSGQIPPRADDPALGPSTDGPQAGGTLRIGLGLDPLSIDPRFVADDEGALVVGALFEPLVRLDDRGQVIPGAARRWEVSDDARTLTFHLRPASFHDGSPVTAEAFVRSFQRIVDGTARPASFLAYLLEPVQGAAEAQRAGAPLHGVEAVDDHTLVIRLVEPRPGFLTTLSDPSLVPVPPMADRDPDGFAAQPIGNGPFAMAGPREPDAFIRLRRFDDHHRRPLLDEVLLQVYPEDRLRDRQWEDLLDGQLHVAEITPERREEAVERFGRSTDGRTGPGLLDGITSTVYLYGFDTTQPPFDDPRVRRAVSLSIDREALATEVLQDTRVPATAIVPPSLPGTQPGACGHCHHDPAAAQTLLDEVGRDLAEGADPGDPAQEPPAPDAGDETASGGEEADATGGAGSDQQAAADEAAAGEGTGEDGPDAAQDEGTGDDGDPPVGEDQADPDEPVVVLDRLTLTYNRGRTHAAIAERLASDIERALGIAVTVQARDLHPFVQAVRAGEVAVFRLGWQATEPDPGAYLYPLFHSSQIGVDNLTRYTNEEVDELLDDARTNPDRGLALARYRRAERLILADAPVLPVLWYRNQRVVLPAVQELVWSPVGRVDLARVWLDPDA